MFISKSIIKLLRKKNKKNKKVLINVPKRVKRASGVTIYSVEREADV